MSLEFRTRLRDLGREKMDATEQEWNSVWENIGDFCFISDVMIKAKHGQDASEDAIIKKMDNNEFIGFAKSILSAGLGKLRKKRGIIADPVEQQINETYDQQGREMFDQRTSVMTENIPHYIRA